MDEFNKSSGYEATIQKAIVFLCTVGNQMYNEQWEIKNFKTTIYNDIKK